MNVYVNVINEGSEDGEVDLEEWFEYTRTEHTTSSSSSDSHNGNDHHHHDHTHSNTDGSADDS